MQKIKHILSGFSLFFLTSYFPIAFMTYCPTWYKINCLLHPGCDLIGRERALRSIDQLTNFFLHLDELDFPWTRKEQFHLAEVRDILDILLILTIIFAVSFFLTYDRNTLPKLARLNAFILTGLIVIVPFFKFFWLNIFHPLLFNNLYWVNNLRDMSYYIMPGAFFKSSIIFFIAVTIIINGGIWILTRTRNVDRA